MNNYPGYYSILNLPETARSEEIKKAFRRLSLKYHPDQNNNSAESNLRFRVILNAYDVLSDPIKKKEYDAYLQRSAVIARWSASIAGTPVSLPGKAAGERKSAAAGFSSASESDLLGQFNFLLWEIEDYIQVKTISDWHRIYHDKTLRRHILLILTFIDRWVLGPAGFPDFFAKAREMDQIDPRKYIDTIGLDYKTSGHMPFVNIQDYFYNIRKRMDNFLNKTKPKDLLTKIPDYNLSLIDCIIEAQNLALHYLSYIFRIDDGDFAAIPPFEYSDPCFIYE